MPKNRKMQNIIGTEHITDVAEAAIAAQATASDIVGDTTPQLGGNLDVNGNAVVSTANGNIELNPNGTGKVVFKGNATKGAGQFVLNCEQNSHGIVIKGPPHSAGASYTLTLPDTDGSANEVLKTDGSGNLDWVAQSSGGGTSYQAFSGFVPALGGTTLYNKINLLQAPYGLYSNHCATGSTYSQTLPVYSPFVLPKDLTMTHLLINVHTTGSNSGVNFEVGVYNTDANGAPSTQLFKSVFPVGSGSSTGDIQVAITNTGGTGALNGGETYWVGFCYDGDPGTYLKTCRMSDSAGSTGGLIGGNSPFTTTGMNNTAFRDGNATSLGGIPSTVTVSGSGFLPLNVDLIAIAAVFS